MFTSIASAIPPLYSYYLYLTTQCNMRCRHCAYDANYIDSGKQVDRFLDIKIIEKALREGIPLGLRSVKLSGGEPLLHPQFVDIIQLISEANLSINIETNGVLLNSKIVHVLSMTSKPVFVAVSLDGKDAQSHEFLRGVHGCFEKVTRGISSLVDAGIHPEIIMCIHKENIDEIEDCANLAADLGCSLMKISMIHETGRKNENGSLKLLSFEELYEIGNKITSDISRHVSIPLIYYWPIAFHSLNQLSSTGFLCSITNILGIMPGGKIVLCGFGDQERSGYFTYGVFGEDTIADIWKNHPQLLNIRESIPSKLVGICSNCIFRIQCRGFCAVQTYNEAGSLTNPFWFCKEAADKGLFPRSRMISCDH
jgi:SynChlorMet cassette radical SAM/SPASM protein ScmF